MKLKLLTASVGYSIGCWISNFGWQVFTAENWHTALERSYFQTLALLTFAGMIHFGEWVSDV